jgi:hypothetical protein
MKMTLQEEARVALAAKGLAERHVARVADCPPWRHAAFGLVMAALVASPALPLPLRFAVLVLVLLAIAAIVASDRRRTGMFVNGYRRGKTLVVSIVTLVVVTGLFMVSARAGDAGDVRTPLLLSAVAFVVAIASSIIWQRVFVAELGE